MVKNVDDNFVIIGKSLLIKMGLLLIISWYLVIFFFI